MLDFIKQGITPLSNTQRWETYPTISDESVAEHVFETCQIAYLLSLQVDEADTHLTIEKALLHDLEESGTSDIPRWAKRTTSDLEYALNDAESEIIDKKLESLPDEISERIKGVWEYSKDDTIEGRLVKCADIISAIYGVHKEEQLGNSELGDLGDIDEGIEYAKEVCLGILPAEKLLNEILDEMERELMVTSDTKLDNFDKDYRLTYFTAEWCGPCEQQKPIIEKFKERGDVYVRKIDIDEHPEITREFNVRGVPSLIMDDGEQIIERWSGITQQYELDSVLP